MTKLWLKIAWIIGVVLGLTGGISKQLAYACPIANKDDNSRLLIAQNSNFCQQMAEGYQEVYAFETQNFYINICRYNQKFYYYRKSKQNPNNTLFLPANNILNGNVFQAIDRGKTYIVGTGDEGYYSSVMHENNEVIFEPELKKSSTLIDDNFDINIGGFKGDRNKRSKCSPERTISDIGLFSWQQFTAG